MSWECLENNPTSQRGAHAVEEKEESVNVVGKGRDSGSRGIIFYEESYDQVKK
jgi:hypothetical protein